ncbi:cell division initiation protein [Allostreptomyces psammosilenae]|uniref:Cell division septum initiation protein DivIVA n=1 Tax=Allostreptomyces psammosilenae TaxID=1892865 RepID=A0A853A831_9ACTN|nr:cell division initiation protein [Allostreptomyces psammosilenae]NYI06592.1 cell division septum initiation protein DivIVA [Allostreptomyces psammosilenae]
MDVSAKIDELLEMVENARSMPMSASCVINRAEMIEIIEELRAALPAELQQAQQVLAERDAVVEEGRREAERIIEGARNERGSLVSQTAVARESQGAADRVLAEARREAEEIRREADDYVDQKLANFEVVLTKTLNAVGRGREKLLGKRPSDELGAYMAAADEAAARADADFDTGEEPPFPGENRFDDDGPFRREPAFASEQAPVVGAGVGQGGTPYQEDGYQEDGYQTGGAGQPFDDGQGGAGYGEQPQGYPGQSPYGDQQPYEPAGYPAGGGYETGQYPADPNAYQGGYDPSGAGAYQAQGYDTGQYAAQGQPPQPGYPPFPHQQQGPGTLDETSFFDTSVIDVDRLRELDGRG